MNTIRQFLYSVKKELNRSKKGLIEAERINLQVADHPNSADELIEIIFGSSIFLPSQKKTELRKYYDLLKTSEARNICEIGTFRGGSLFITCQAAPENANIISVDINYPFSKRLVFKKFAKPGQRLTTLKGSTQEHKTEAKIRRVLDGQPLDFLFIDGDHSLFGVMNDFVRFQPLVREGGLIVFHDINPDQRLRTGQKTTSYVGEVPLFWKFLKDTGYQAEEFTDDPNQDGFGLGVIVNHQ